MIIYEKTKITAIAVIIIKIIKETDTMELKKHNLKLLNQIKIDRRLSMNSYGIVFQIMSVIMLHKGGV